jgi:hypothetical protein
MKSRQHSREGSTDLSGLLGALPESPFASHHPLDSTDLESLDGSELLSSFHGAGENNAAMNSDAHGLETALRHDDSVEGLPFVDGGFFDDELALEPQEGAASLSFVHFVEAAPQLSLFNSTPSVGHDYEANRSIEDDLLECQSFGQSLRDQSNTA